MARNVYVSFHLGNKGFQQKFEKCQKIKWQEKEKDINLTLQTSDEEERGRSRGIILAKKM